MPAPHAIAHAGPWVRSVSYRSTPCSGVTDGELLNGVNFFGGGYRTQTLFMSLTRRILRFVDTIYREDLTTSVYFGS